MVIFYTKLQLYLEITKILNTIAAKLSFLLCAALDKLNVIRRIIKVL